jgi:hypothetical protein
MASFADLDSSNLIFEIQDLTIELPFFAYSDLDHRKVICLKLCFVAWRGAVGY